MMITYELHIFDKEGSGHYLLSIMRLLEAVDQVRPDALSGCWYILRGSWGHGNMVDSIEYSLQSKNQVRVNVMSLFRLLRTGHEQFNKAHFRKEIHGGLLELGIEGRNRYLYVTSDDRAFLEAVAAQFTDTTLEEKGKANAK